MCPILITAPISPSTNIITFLCYFMFYHPWTQFSLLPFLILHIFLCPFLSLKMSLLKNPVSPMKFPPIWTLMTVYSRWRSACSSISALHFLQAGHGVQRVDETLILSLSQDRVVVCSFTRRYKMSASLFSFLMLIVICTQWLGSLIYLISLGLWYITTLFPFIGWNDFIKRCFLSSTIWLPSCTAHKGQAI